MELSQYVKVLRQRWLQIALCVLLGIAAGVGVIAITPAKYQTGTKIFVSSTDAQSDLTQAVAGSQLGQQRVLSYADIVASKPVVQKVVDDLHLTDSVKDVQSEIQAVVPANTVVVNIIVTDRSASRAKAIADQVATEFSTYVNTLETPQGSTVSPVKVSVVETADLPTAPISPKKGLDLLLGLLLGVVVGVGVAVLRGVLDTTLKTPEDVARTTDLVTLGVVVFDPETSKHPFVVEHAPHSVRAEAFRQLRTNLQFVDVETPTRSIVVTSTLPREGKSTTTINLALTLARGGRRVCLIEGDLRRPRVGRYIGIGDDLPGLTDVLIGQAAVADVLQPYKDTGLTLLPCGSRPPNPSELLGSTAMRTLIADLEQSFDIVLIDAPPLLPVTDAAVLSRVCDSVVLIVRAASTRREQVRHALDSLRAVDARILGAVLNMVPTRGPDAYIYGYGYGYDAYGEKAPKGGRHKAPEAAALAAAAPAPAPAPAVVEPAPEVVVEPAAEPPAPPAVPVELPAPADADLRH